MRARIRPISAAAAAAACTSVAFAACGGSGGAGATQASTTAVSGVARLDRIVKVRQPTSIATPPNDPDDLYITTKPGVIYVVHDGKLQHKPFLDLRHLTKSKGSEQGMFCIAFAPDFATSHKFYVSHNNADNSVQIDEFEVSKDDPLEADPDSRRPILNAQHGEGHRTQHNGGELQFGPDGYLYIGLGDGGPVEKPYVSNRAQQRAAILGKILRIDPEHPSDGLPYTIPDDNPFVKDEDKGFRGEIYSYGLRNPFRFSFDKETGALAIGDVGAASYEEVDYVDKGQGKGANFGWPHFEGTHPFRTDYPLSPGPDPRPVTMPIHTYSHSHGCSVIGGYTIRDPRIPQLDGKYVYGDACTGDLRVLTPTPQGAEDDQSLGLQLPPTTSFGIVSFGQGSDGRIYAASFGGGVYALDPARQTKQAAGN